MTPLLYASLTEQLWRQRKCVKGSLILTKGGYRNKPADIPRQLRIEYPGAIYHVMNRGDRREP
jgi:hypothetical protein